MCGGLAKEVIYTASLQERAWEGDFSRFLQAFAFFGLTAPGSILYVDSDSGPALVRLGKDRSISMKKVAML